MITFSEFKNILTLISSKDRECVTLGLCLWENIGGKQVCMNDVKKEEFFNLINLLKSPDKESQYLGKMMGLTLGIIINANEYQYSFQYSFRYKNSYWFINQLDVFVHIPSLLIHETNPSEEIWLKIK